MHMSEDRCMFTRGVCKMAAGYAQHCGGLICYGIWICFDVSWVFVLQRKPSSRQNISKVRQEPAWIRASPSE